MTQLLERASAAPAADGHQTRAGPRLFARDLLLPTALVMWAVSARSTDIGAMNDWGLLAVFPITFYVAVALVVTSCILTLHARELSTVRLAVHLIALILVIHGTVPFMFDTPSYPWTYKHIGVVEYIDTQGALDTSIDIYHNWPGFFSLAAFFSEVAGVADPMAYAGWCPVFFNLLIVLQLSFVFASLPVNRRLRWLAYFFFVPANWIGQDYFAPQAIAMVLSLAVFGLALRWLVSARVIFLVRRVYGWVRAILRVRAPLQERFSSERRGRVSVGVLAAMFSVFFVLVITHQLTPYFVLSGLGLLAAVGLVRPRWVVAVLAMIAIGYLILRYPNLSKSQNLFASMLDPLDNLNGNGVGNRGMTGRRITALAAPAIMLGVFTLGGIGALLRIRAGRPALIMVALAASPVFIALGQAYGGEAVFRVYLFALPWLVLLAASAFEPPSLPFSKQAAMAVLAGLVALFMMVFFGAMELYRVRASDITVSRYFYQHADKGSVLMLGAPRFPSRVSANYDGYIGTDATPHLLHEDADLVRRNLGRRDVARVTKFAQMQEITGNGDAYLALSDDLRTYGEITGALPRGALTRLERELIASDDWQVVCTTANATLLRMTPGRDHIDTPCRVKLPADTTWSSRSDAAGAGAGAAAAAVIALAASRFRRRRTPEETEVDADAFALVAGVLTSRVERADAVALLGAVTHREVDTIVCMAPRDRQPDALVLLAEAWGPFSSGEVERFLCDQWDALRAAALHVMHVNADEVPVLDHIRRFDPSEEVRAVAAAKLSA